MKNIRLINKVLLFFVLAAILVYFTKSPFRIDFTEDRRYSISDYSRDLMADIQNPMEVKLYLSGDLNPAFYKLRKATLDLLHDFASYSSHKINIVSVNPSDAVNEDERYQKYNELADKGLIPTDVYMRDKNGNSVRKTIFPWLEITYQNRNLNVPLLKNQAEKSGEENINISIENLEFEVASAIFRLQQEEVQKIAFLEGHGELSEAETYQITKSLSAYYQIDRGVFMNDASVLSDYEAVIIAGPKEAFSEVDKYILDQYIMYGGKVIWLIDAVRVDRQMLATQGNTPAIRQELNLDDLFFKYGLRFIPSLVQDLQCSFLPVNIAPEHEAPQFDLKPWYNAPLLLSAPYHPITRNIGELKSEFVSVIEYRASSHRNAMLHTLLASSHRSRLVATPAVVSLEDFHEVDEESFTVGYQPVAVLMEDVFVSNYRNRMQPEGIEYAAPFKEESYFTQQLFIAGSSIIRNETSGIASDTTTLPLGYDRVMDITFGNESFFVNAVNYMTGNAGLINLRAKEFQIRLLNQQISKEKRTKLQIVNIVLPLIILMFCALIFYWIRRMKYIKKSS